MAKAMAVTVASAAEVVEMEEAAMVATAAEVVEIEEKEVVFGGPSLGTRVYVDGRHIGNSPQARATLLFGSHVVRMVTADGELETVIEVGETTPTRYAWRRGTDRMVGL